MSFQTRSMYKAIVVVLISVVMLASRGWAQEAQPTKGSDVMTVGSGPYTGPTAAELAKAASAAGMSFPEDPPRKAVETATISRGGGTFLTAAEQAKLQTLLRTLPPPDMQKLPVMEISKDGIPEMTAQEVQKLAEISRDGGVGTTAGGSGGTVTGDSQIRADAPVSGEAGKSQNENSSTRSERPSGAER